MPREMIISGRHRNSFTATHHALLFAWISRAVVEGVGVARGETAIRKAVRRYGEQRGRRMALRAQADGQALSMGSFRAYGEWEVDAGQMEHSVVSHGRDMKTHVRKCPWHTAWTEGDLVAYGRFYCLEIDEALVRGFNPNLKLEVNRTQTNDGEYCEFVYRDVGGTVSRRGVVMPWGYHTGHLYKTVAEVVVEELGEVGREAVKSALADFAERYGEEAARSVMAYQNTDFDVVPGQA